MKKQLFALLLSAMVFAGTGMEAVAASVDAGAGSLGEIKKEDDMISMDESIPNGSTTIQTISPDTSVNLNTQTYVELSAKSYNYDGKAKKPTIKVYKSDKKTILSSKYYTVKYSNNPVKVGTYKVTVTLKNGYKGQGTFEYVINPPKTTVNIGTVNKDSAKVSIKKVTTQTEGYQLRLTGAGTSKSINIKNVNTSYTFKSLKSSTIYSVKVRTYKKVNGKTYYSAWSKAGNFTTKKSTNNSNNSSNINTNTTQFSGARSLKLDNKYSYTWNKDNAKNNFYNKFTTNSNGIVHITMNKAFNSIGYLVSYDVEIYDSGKNLIWYAKTSSMQSTKDNIIDYYIGLEKGTYYLNLKPTFPNNFAMTVNLTYGVYFNADKYIESEKNNTKNEAVELTAGNLYTGYYGEQFYEYKDEDWYKFKAEKGSTYTIMLDNNKGLLATTCLCTLIDPYGNETLIRYNTLKPYSGDIYAYSFPADYSGYYFIRLCNFDNKPPVYYRVGIN